MTEKEVAANLEPALEMEVDFGKEGEGEIVGTLMALVDTGFLMKDAELCGTTIVDARNGINKLIPLEMLWNVQHCCPAGKSFMFNCYKRWAHLILLHPGKPSVTFLILEGVTQGYPLLVVLYGINLFPLAEELREAVLSFSPCSKGMKWHSMD